jgi:NAD(P)-dependent dehydrogenase (short-subunit alcohol dehydrogenase family)
VPVLDFEGRVAIVTGAGRGIGRATALALAKRGAKVLVNDYGGGEDTMTPGSIDVAQAVADEIASMGGVAVADASSVGSSASAEAIVGKAIGAFGRIDILVNNAGGSPGIVDIDKDTDERVEDTVRVNLLGPYFLVRRVWPHMRSQNYGRIVSMMSGVMLGMAGVAAYAIGKSGLMGLTNTAAVEGAQYGILANGVMPVAYTRLVHQMDDATIAWMKQFPAERVAEGVVFLCSSANRASGEIFHVRSDSMCRLAVYGGAEAHIEALTAERLAEHFDKVRDMNGAVLHPTSQAMVAHYEQHAKR